MIAALKRYVLGGRVGRTYELRRRAVELDRVKEEAQRLVTALVADAAQNDAAGSAGRTAGIAHVAHGNAEKSGILSPVLSE